MHEIAIAEGIVRVAEQAARERGFDRVVAVIVEIGELAGVEPQALRFCFDAVTRGGAAAGARLEIESVPGRGWCLRCEREVALPQRFDPCPHCGSHQVQPTGGTEMRVRSIEAEHAGDLASGQDRQPARSVESDDQPTPGER